MHGTYDSPKATKPPKSNAGGGRKKPGAKTPAGGKVAGKPFPAK